MMTSRQLLSVAGRSDFTHADIVIFCRRSAAASAMVTMPDVPLNWSALPAPGRPATRVTPAFNEPLLATSPVTLPTAPSIAEPLASLKP